MSLSKSRKVLSNADLGTNVLAMGVSTLRDRQESPGGEREPGLEALLPNDCNMIQQTERAALRVRDAQPGEAEPLAALGRELNTQQGDPSTYFTPELCVDGFGDTYCRRNACIGLTFDARSAGR